MDTATVKLDFGKLLDLNRSFHFSIYDSSERPLLTQMISGLWDRSARYRYIYTYLPERQIQALGEHKEIYDACLKGETPRAVQAVRNNVHQTVEGIVSKLRADGFLEVGAVLEMARPQV